MALKFVDQVNPDAAMKVALDNNVSTAEARSMIASANGNYFSDRNQLNRLINSTAAATAKQQKADQVRLNKVLKQITNLNKGNTNTKQPEPIEPQAPQYIPTRETRYQQQAADIGYTLTETDAAGLARISLPPINSDPYVPF